MGARGTWAFGVACFVAGLALGARARAEAGEDGDADYRALAVFARAFQHIEGAWVGDVEPEALSHAAIRGMVSTLDGHSRFFDPREAAAAEAEARAEAQRANRVTVRHERLELGVAYLAIDAFRDSTAREVEEALAALRPFDGLILDLRDDPGGLLASAVRIADLWLSDGVIVSTRGKSKPPEVSRAHPQGTEPGYPIVVLTNERTASAAEVLAAALAEHRRARLVGATTYGKGSVQTILELEDRSALKLTVARYYTPSGRSLEGQGLEPEIAVSAGPAAPARLSEDPFVLRAIAALKESAGRSFTGPKARAISRP